MITCGILFECERIICTIKELKISMFDAFMMLNVLLSKYMCELNLGIVRD